MFFATNETPLKVNTLPCESGIGSTAEIDTLEAAVTPDGSADRLDVRDTVAGVVPVAVRVNVAVYVAIRRPS
jgi:hypothetical protein